ncbi:EH_Signature domain-containing protein [Prosthecobacter debontii]|uniref:EH_Signature domain-containing protein n=2 Tax=Prosthecobacter debontii TaxID=48467 RepID=A0A1T4WTX7_9BACT|nr:EH_Signature domain-containing protein [Prosthecobacter debontii]
MSAVVKSLQAVAQSHAATVQMHAPPELDRLRMLAVKMGSVPVPPPLSEAEVNGVWSQVQAWLGSDQPARALSLDIWKQVPALLWRTYEGQQAIEYPRLREGIAWAASMSVSLASWIETLATAYTEASDANEEGRAWLGDTLRQWCDVEGHEHIDVWRRRDRDWDLFSPDDFPVKLACRLQNSPDMSLRSVLAEAGFLTARAQAADLSRQAFLAYLNIPIPAAQGYDFLHLERIREWKNLLFGESSAWDEVLCAAVINGLLEPWAAFNPSELELQKEIQKRTLEGWFGSVPEGWTGYWSAASSLSRQILERWMILDVMEDFFQRVGQYAEETGSITMRRQWRYRRHFWLAYYKRGVVKTARALLGHGIIQAYGEPSLRKKFGDAMAELQSQDPDQCGLLLQIHELMLIDLSHHGAAYFFLPSNKQKPPADAAIYDRSSLNLLKDVSKSHHGSDAYLWQSDFESLIFDQTGVRLTLSDYSV